MATLFDSASLVMIPSGYKEDKVYSIKPTDGSGDLAFSRSNDTATRVNSSGLIEKVRTNLFTYSEQLDNAAWFKKDSNIIANAVANPLNGAVTADKIIDANTTLTTRSIYQLPTSSGNIYTSSGYFKKAEYNFVTLHAFGLSGATFNLDTGVKVSQGGGVGTITSVGNGWYRCTFSFTAGSSSVFFSQSPAGNKTYTGTTGSGIFAFGLQLETGDIVTDYIATTSAAVSVGPVANLPRLDYSGGASCPKLLLEPQRVNKWYFSESFDNAEWLKSNVTISANSAVSPDGYTNADKMVDTTANDEHRIRATTALFTITTATTFSIFAKAAEYSKFAIADLSLSEYVKFNLSTGVVISTGSGFSNAKIEDYGNGWYRLSATNSSVSTYGYGLLNDAGDFVFTGTGTKGVFIYGAQVEEAAYATSYIPTLSAASTRGADAAYKTGISSLIGQTEGTLFAEVVVNDNSISAAIRLRNSATGLYNDTIALGFTDTRQPEVITLTSGVTQVNIIGTALSTGTHKIAFAYKLNDFALYADGVQIGTSSSGTIPIGMNDIYIDQFIDGGIRNASQKQTLIFKTRLTNAELAALTTI